MVEVNKSVERLKQRLALSRHVPGLEGSLLVPSQLVQVWILQLASSDGMDAATTTSAPTISNNNIQMTLQNVVRPSLVRPPPPRAPAITPTIRTPVSPLRGAAPSSPLRGSAPNSPVRALTPNKKFLYRQGNQTFIIESNTLLEKLRAGGTLRLPVTALRPVSLVNSSPGPGLISIQSNNSQPALVNSSKVVSQSTSHHQPLINQLQSSQPIISQINQNSQINPSLPVVVNQVQSPVATKEATKIIQQPSSQTGGIVLSSSKPVNGLSVSSNVITLSGGLTAGGITLVRVTSSSGAAPTGGAGTVLSQTPPQVILSSAGVRAPLPTVVTGSTIQRPTLNQTKKVEIGGRGFVLSKPGVGGGITVANAVTPSAATNPTSTPATPPTQGPPDIIRQLNIARCQGLVVLQQWGDKQVLVHKATGRWIMRQGNRLVTVPPQALGITPSSTPEPAAGDGSITHSEPPSSPAISSRTMAELAEFDSILESKFKETVEEAVQAASVVTVVTSKPGSPIKQVTIPPTSTVILPSSPVIIPSSPVVLPSIQATTLSASPVVKPSVSLATPTSPVIVPTTTPLPPSPVVALPAFSATPSTVLPSSPVVLAAAPTHMASATPTILQPPPSPLPSQSPSLLPPSASPSLNSTSIVLPTTPVRKELLNVTDKPQEDPETMKRIQAILDNYNNQMRNSPDLHNRPAPRRRTTTTSNGNPDSPKSESPTSGSSSPSSSVGGGAAPSPSSSVSLVPPSPTHSIVGVASNNTTNSKPDALSVAVAEIKEPSVSVVEHHHINPTGGVVGGDIVPKSNQTTAPNRQIRQVMIPTALAASLAGQRLMLVNSGEGGRRMLAVRPLIVNSQNQNRPVTGNLNGGGSGDLQTFTVPITVSLPTSPLPATISLPTSPLPTSIALPSSPLQPTTISLPTSPLPATITLPNSPLPPTTIALPTSPLPTTIALPTSPLPASMVNIHKLDKPMPQGLDRLTSPHFEKMDLERPATPGLGIPMEMTPGQIMEAEISATLLDSPASPYPLSPPQERMTVSVISSDSTLTKPNIYRISVPLTPSSESSDDNSAKSERSESDTSSESGSRSFKSEPPTTVAVKRKQQPPSPAKTIALPETKAGTPRLTPAEEAANTAFDLLRTGTKRERRVSSRQNNNKTVVAMNPTTVESPTSKQSLPSQNRRKRPLPEDSSLPEAKKFRGRGAEEDTGPPRTSNRVRK